jgi:hypothetical protein
LIVVFTVSIVGSLRGSIGTDVIELVPDEPEPMPPPQER